MRIPEGDETFFEVGSGGRVGNGMGNRRPPCRLCKKTIYVNEELVLCLHCEGSQHFSCYETSPNCPSCSLPTLRRSEKEKEREAWPCAMCKKNFTLVVGFSFCASCGARFHRACRGIFGRCPCCKENAPVFDNAENEVNLSGIERILRGRENLEDCFYGCWWISVFCLCIYCFFGYLGLEIGYEVAVVFSLNMLWWIYCAVLTRTRQWP